MQFVYRLLTSCRICVASSNTCSGISIALTVVCSLRPCLLRLQRGPRKRWVVSGKKADRHKPHRYGPDGGKGLCVCREPPELEHVVNSSFLVIFSCFLLHYVLRRMLVYFRLSDTTTADLCEEPTWVPRIQEMVATEYDDLIYNLLFDNIGINRLFGTPPRHRCPQTFAFCELFQSCLAGNVGLHTTDASVQALEETKLSFTRLCCSQAITWQVAPMLQRSEKRQCRGMQE